MSTENIIGVDPLDWMNKEEIEECKEELQSAENSVENVIDSKDNQTEIIQSAELSESPKLTETNQSIESSEEIDHTEISLDKHFDIRCIDLVNEIFFSSMEKGKDIHIDLSEIDKTDAAAMQYLASFKKTAEDKLITVKLVKSNDYVNSAIRLLGLQNILAA